MRRWSIQLFRVRGIALEIHPTFWLLPLLVGAAGWSDGGWAGVLSMWWALALVYACVVLHEFGHALAARALDVPVSRIFLLPVGGLAMLGKMPRDPAVELLIVAAGPMVNFAIAGASLLLLGGVPQNFGMVDPATFHWRDLLHFLLAANIMLGLFNLVPAFPMDGGRLLRAMLAWRLGYLRATTIALRVGQVIAITAIFFAVWFGIYTLALLFGFILLLGDLEYTQLQREEAAARPQSDPLF